VPAFSSFVIFAEMRTGSNHLEATLNQLDGVRCYGELYNPRFIGHANQKELFGIDLDARRRDPAELLRRLGSSAEELSGFRYFHDHDHRVLDSILEDRTRAKVILQRDMIECYVSMKIATKTGYWRITDESHRVPLRVKFDQVEFEAFARGVTEFQIRLRRALQRTGQTAFDLDYTDLNDHRVLTGLGHFLGRSDYVYPSTLYKRQNPEPLEQKVENREELEKAYLKFSNSRSSRALTVDYRSLIALDQKNLLYLPIPGAADAQISSFLHDLGDIHTDFTVESLRPWLNRRKERTVFSVVSHPVTRAFRLCTRALGHKPQRQELLDYLTRRSVIGLSDDESCQASFFERWSAEIIPDRILREGELAEFLAAQFPGFEFEPAEFQAEADDEIEVAVRRLYNRDYRTFGFRRFSVG